MSSAHRNGTCPSGDVTLFYRRFGAPGHAAKSAPVLILHGLSYFSYDWIGIAAELAAESRGRRHGHARVRRLDLEPVARLRRADDGGRHRRAPRPSRLAAGDPRRALHGRTERELLRGQEPGARRRPGARRLLARERARRLEAGDRHGRRPAGRVRERGRSDAALRRPEGLAEARAVRGVSAPGARRRAGQARSALPRPVPAREGDRRAPAAGRGHVAGARRARVPDARRARRAVRHVRAGDGRQGEGGECPHQPGGSRRRPQRRRRQPAGVPRRNPSIHRRAGGSKS